MKKHAGLGSVWVGLVLAVLAGCEGASVEGKTACRDQSDCLSGYACIDDVCVATSEGCDAYCANGCGAVEACGIDTGPECMDQCIVDLGSSDCSRYEPLDRISCSQIEHAVECASYCEAVCQRGSECASIDPELCALGCVDKKPSICNPKSIEPRSCEKIIVETRMYDVHGRSLVGSNDGTTIGGLDNESFGLCEDYEECDEPLVCSSETNTCAMCQSDAECDGGVVPSVCTPEGCMDVDCLTDDDCLSGVCDAAAHECHDCREDADCSSEATPACDQERMECVACTTDEHCAMGIFGASLMERICDVDLQQCVQCLEDAHCADSSFPSCDQQLHFCVPAEL